MSSPLTCSDYFMASINFRIR